MGGQRFEINDPDYLFGDNFDLNFLSCTKPHHFPYKQAQQNLLSHLTAEQKSTSKCSSNTVSRFSSSFNRILPGYRYRQEPANINNNNNSNTSSNNINNNKQDAQTQTSSTTNTSDSKGIGADPSKPIVMLINIRKETLRLVKSSTQQQPLDSEPDSLASESSVSVAISDNRGVVRLTKKRKPLPKNVRQSSTFQGRDQPLNREPTEQNQVTQDRRPKSTSSVGFNGDPKYEEIVDKGCDDTDDFVSEIGSDIRPPMWATGTNNEPYNCTKVSESEISSLLSATSSIRSGFTSVVQYENQHSMNTSTVEVGHNDVDDEDDDDDEEFKDALNYSLKSQDTQINLKNNNHLKETISNQIQDCELLTKKENCDIMINIEGIRDATTSNTRQAGSQGQNEPNFSGERISTKNKYSAISPSSSQKTATKIDVEKNSKPDKTTNSPGSSGKSLNKILNPIYNIEFTFDAHVKCSIRIFYLCTKEVTPNGMVYKPQHATYKSKIYNFPKGLNQKFDQQEHTFEPYLFDEDLLIYKPQDLDGNYNSKAIFPIVIHCVALKGSTPRQSQSLIATIEKSQLDESYSIKPLKQLIFVDGIQYILQDIYGIENNPTASIDCNLNPANRESSNKDRVNRSKTLIKPVNEESKKPKSSSTSKSNLDLSDISSLASLDNFDRKSINRGSLRSCLNHKGSLIGAENTSECVICMSEGRDTMLLPCRHLCLCSSCAQSLRYQANSCPICRCPFKAALNLRSIQRHPMDNSRLRQQAVRK